MSKRDSDNASWLRPLPEDFADKGHYNKRRVALVAVTVAVLLGFSLLIWFSYTSEDDEGGPVPVIRADGSVVKEKPDEPGGKEIPFQDKEVFNRVDNMPKEEEDVLASSAEIPLKRPVAAEVIEQEDVIVEEVVEEEKPKEVPVLAPVGNFMVQVGAFADRAIAEKFWADVKTKNSSALSKLNPTYMKVDLGARGVLYRVRGGMLANRADADKTCDALKKNNQGCMVVTK